MKRPAIVQTVFDFAIREINALEDRIVKAEDDADAMLWEQAGQVATQLKAGSSLRKLAAQWINARTGEPYHFTHVHHVAQVYSQLYSSVPRPRFRDAYNEIANSGSDSVAHVSHNSGENEWYTPSEYLEAARYAFGGDIDLDPATTEAANEVVQAAQIFTTENDGLKQAWSGRVWLNPPYAQPLIDKFISKLVAHVRARDLEAAIVLVNNATDTEWFQKMAPLADAICFKNGRIKFWGPDGTKGSPLQGQAFLYFGTDPRLFIQHFRAFGSILVRL